MTKHSFLAMVAAGLTWSAASAAQPIVDLPFYGPVDLTDPTPRTVLWQFESTPCNGSDRYGPDGRVGTDDDFGLPGNPTLAESVFLLDPGCAARANDPGAEFKMNLALNDLPGMPPGTDLSRGFPADFTSDGATVTVAIQGAVWGPVLKKRLEDLGDFCAPGDCQPILVDAASASDYVFEIDVVSGEVTDFAWTANADTALGPSMLNGALLPGTTARWYSAEPTAAPAASGARAWACGTGGFLAQPENTPSADPGSFGTCPPNNVNPSPTVENAAYDPATGTLYANASSAVLGPTPRAWGPLDGRLVVNACGNGVLDGDEACDDGGESAICDDNCTLVACGDYNVNETAGERCDDGNVLPDDGCDPTCQWNTVEQAEPQQTCIQKINAAMLGVLKKQNKNSSTCLKNVAAGKLTVEQCIGIDLGGKIAAAEAKTSTTELKKCQAPNTPGFAYTSAATANAGAKGGALDAVTTVFGDAPAVADKKTDKAGAACQAEVAKRQFKLQATWLTEANKAKKAALKGKGTAPVSDPTELATAIDTAVEGAGNKKITTAENGVNSGIDKKCGAAAKLADLFDCNGAATTDQLAACVIVAAEGEACRALEQADGLSLTCKGDPPP